MNMEKRSGKIKRIIQKALIELEGKYFIFYVSHKDEWEKGYDMFDFPWVIQYNVSKEICEQSNKTRLFEQN